MGEGLPRASTQGEPGGLGGREERPLCARRSPKKNACHERVQPFSMSRGRKLRAGLAAPTPAV